MNTTQGTTLSLITVFPDDTRTVSISLDKWDVTLDDLMEEMIIPLLHAAGYSPESIKALSQDYEPHPTEAETLDAMLVDNAAPSQAEQHYADWVTTPSVKTAPVPPLHKISTKKITE